jgi:hypothetical protein
MEAHTMATPALTSNWPGGKTVLINTRRITGQDVLGNDQYEVVESRPVQAILVPLQMKLAPRATRGASFAEELQGEFIVAAGLTAFFPPGTVITITDEVIVDGEAWRVSGVPGNYQSPFTGVAGCLQCELVRVTG